MNDIPYDNMTCAYCGGMVQWLGRWDSLAGTKCTRCGAINPPVVTNTDNNLLDEVQPDVR